MKKKKPKQGGNRSGAGRPMAYPGEGRSVRLSFSAPETLVKRLGMAAEQVGQSQSAIVVAGLRAILSQSTDRLADTLRGK